MNPFDLFFLLIVIVRNERKQSCANYRSNLEYTSFLLINFRVLYINAGNYVLLSKKYSFLKY